MRPFGMWELSCNHDFECRLSREPLSSCKVIKPASSMVTWQRIRFSMPWLAGLMHHLFIDFKAAYEHRPQRAIDENEDENEDENGFPGSNEERCTKLREDFWDCYKVTKSHAFFSMSTLDGIMRLRFSRKPVNWFASRATEHQYQYIWNCGRGLHFSETRSIKGRTGGWMSWLSCWVLIILI